MTQGPSLSASPKQADVCDSRRRNPLVGGLGRATSARLIRPAGDAACRGEKRVGADAVNPYLHSRKVPRLRIIKKRSFLRNALRRNDATHDLAFSSGLLRVPFASYDVRPEIG